MGNALTGDIIQVAVLVPLCAVLLVWGIALMAGKWFGSLAGNRTAKGEEAQGQESGPVGRVVGAGMIVFACVMGAQPAGPFMRVFF